MSKYKVSDLRNDMVQNISVVTRLGFKVMSRQTSDRRNIT